MENFSIFLISKDLGLHSIFKYHLEHLRLLGNILPNLCVNLVEKCRERTKNRWFQSLDIGDKIFKISTAKTNSKSKHDGVDNHDLLVNMGHRHIGEINVICGEAEA